MMVGASREVPGETHGNSQLVRRPSQVPPEKKPVQAGHELTVTTLVRDSWVSQSASSLTA